MMLVHGNNVVHAWTTAVNSIIDSRGEIFNLIVNIENPSSIDGNWTRILDPRKIDHRIDGIRDTINTIFSFYLFMRSEDRHEFYKMYENLHERAKSMSRNRHRWGTYFERLTQVPDSCVGGQLERAIRALTKWEVRAKAAITFHLSIPSMDGLRKRGGPCWQYAELLWRENDVIDMLCVYRNHDYVRKALGNFIALGYLLDFICRESGKRPGRIVCHSAHAFVDLPHSKVRSWLQSTTAPHSD
jgi:hypothetical protein